jgi:hypothetical protein
LHSIPADLDFPLGRGTGTNNGQKIRSSDDMKCVFVSNSSPCFSAA